MQGTGRGLYRASEGAQQGRFSRAIFSDNGVYFAGAKIQVDGVQCDGCTVTYHHAGCP
jgi:hypothetical protein